MNPSEYNRELTIERRVQMGVKSLGNPNYVWETFATIFCRPSVTRGREHFDQATKQRYSEDVYLFQCHYSDIVGVDASMQILDEDGSRFDIKSMRPDAEDRQDCIIECTLQDATIGPAALMGFVDDAIPDGRVSAPYGGFSFKARGGCAPYAFSVASGALPTGLALNASTGAVAGTPTAAAESTFAVKVTDDDGVVHFLPAVTVTIAA